MYGQAPLVGSTIDPRLFIHDFSTLNKANELKAQGKRELGNIIAQGITQVGDYFKQQGEKKKQVKAASTQIDAALKLMPELAPVLGDVGNRLKDEDVSLSDRYADASIVGDLIKNSMSGLMSQQMMNLRQQKFAASQAQASGGGATGGGGGNWNSLTQ